MTSTPLAYAVRLLAQRPYHSTSLKRKMVEKGFSAQEADGTLEQLRSMKYLDDAAFMENFFRDQLERKAQSVRLARQKLMQRGVPCDDIEAFFGSGAGEKWMETEVDRARAAAAKKVAVLGALGPDAHKARLALKQKVSRFLAARGFSGDTIGKVLKESF